MKADILRICGLGAAFILAEAILAPILLFGASYQAVALNAYIAIGLCCLFFGAANDRLNRDERRQSLEELILKSLRPGRLSRLRARLAAYLSYILVVTCWPAVVFGIHSFRIARV